MAVFGEKGGVKLNFWFCDPQKARPRAEPRLLTYFDVIRYKPSVEFMRYAFIDILWSYFHFRSKIWRHHHVPWLRFPIRQRNFGLLLICYTPASGCKEKSRSPRKCAARKRKLWSKMHRNCVLSTENVWRNGDRSYRTTRLHARSTLLIILGLLPLCKPTHFLASQCYCR